MVRRRVGAKALLVPLPFPVWHALAGVAERLPSPPITRDQVELMRRDNVVSGAEAGFPALDTRPRPLAYALTELLQQPGSAPGQWHGEVWGMKAGAGMLEAGEAHGQAEQRSSGTRYRN